MAEAAAKPEASTPELSPAEEQLKRWREVIDKIRGRADLTAKGLGGLGTAALTAVGIAKVGDVFPVEWHFWTGVWAALMVAGFAAMAGVVVAFSRRLAEVNAPVFISTRLSRIRGIHRRERMLVEQTYEDMAELNAAPSLRAYHARAFRLERIADTSAPRQAEKLRSKAAAIRAEVRAVQGQAAADVVRQRGTEAFNGRSSRLLYFLAVVGFLAFAIGADYLEAERTRDDTLAKTRIGLAKERAALAKDRIGVAADCASLRKAYSEQSLEATLPKICPAVSQVTASAAPQAKVPTTRDAEAGAYKDLAARLEACRTAVTLTKGKPDPDDDARCDRIQAVLAAALRPPDVGRGP